MHLFPYTCVHSFSSIFLYVYCKVLIIIIIIILGSPYVKASMSKIHLQVQFPHYLSAYQSEAIKVAAVLGFWLPARDDFHSSKLANQTLGWPQLTLGQKRRQINPYELFSTISKYICKLFMYMVTFNSEQVVFYCNCMTNSLWTSVYVALYGI